MASRTAVSRRRGVSLLEMVSALAILAIVVAATVSLYVSGNMAHRRAGFYSRAQTDIRSAMRQMTRVIRGSERVVAQGTVGTLSGLATTNYQVVVRLLGTPARECRYYVSNGVLYEQTSSENAPGRALLSGVVSLTFNYYRTAAGTRLSANGAPATATEVEINIRARSGTVTTGLVTYVTIRSTVAGST